MEITTEELKQKMGAAFDEKMNQYSQTGEAQQNWNEDFANVPDDTYKPNSDMVRLGTNSKP